MRVLKSLMIAGVLAATAPAAAGAATLYTYAGPSAQTLSPGSIAVTFDGGAGAATAVFDITGFLSIDGLYGGIYGDTFTLKLNGTDIYSALFPLGGEGVTSVTLAPAGATQAVTNNGFFGGGVARISVPLTLVEGENTLTFAYAGIAQGAGDESWGLSNLTVSGNAVQVPVGGVPEPATWAMMLLGFMGMGVTLRARRATLAA